ncbi:MAG: hypothetical protein DHS20C11_18890 [Lysobacteraceae bacterium]|nr:MAG: hypothetical protein DHS20C11_18890 [Xanthomonadaceae bacterium]
MKTWTTAAILVLIPAGLMMHTETGKLVDPFADEHDELGRAVAIGGGRVIAGSQFDDDVGSASGSATIYHRGYSEGVAQMNRVAKVIGSDTSSNDRFGFAVAINDNYALVGAPFGDRNMGRTDVGLAYIFEYYETEPDVIEWSQRRRLTSIDGAADDGFGWAVAMSNTVAVVGAPRADQLGEDTGAVYVFERDGNNWPLSATLFADPAADQALFGSSVAIDGERIVVGAFLDEHMGEQTGAVYVFERVVVDDEPEWMMQQRLTASDGNPFDEFGFAVDISGDLLVVGAPDDDDASDIAGAAYVFEFMGAVKGIGGGWVEQAKLIASDAGIEEEFGSSVGISDGVVLIGKHWDDALGTDAGSAYVFQSVDGIWTEQSRLTASDGAAGDEFAFAVGIDRLQGIVGARFHDSEGENAGAAYFFAPAQLLGDELFDNGFENLD